MSDPSSYLAKEREVAIQAVLLACSLTLKVFHRLVKGEVIEKDDKTPVTVADLSSQAIISHLLSLSFPSSPLVGEEDADALRSDPILCERAVGLVNETLQQEGGLEKLEVEQILKAIDRGASFEGGSGRFWTCDPIDGTKGFVRGGQYAVCLALIDSGLPILSVIGCPNMLVDPKADQSKEDGEKGVVFVAVKGQGAYSAPISNPSTQTPLQIAPLTSSTPLLESHDPHHSDHALSALASYALGIRAPPLQIDSQAKYCELVRGNGGVFFRVRLPKGKVFEEKIWDHAPGSLLVTESGGLITTLTSTPLSFSSGRTFSSLGIFASHASSHPRVLASIRDAVEMQKIEDGEGEGEEGEEIEVGREMRTEEQKREAGMALGMERQVRMRAEWERKGKEKKSEE